MTKRERVERAMACEPTDRVPVYDKLRNDRANCYYAGRPLCIRDGLRTVCLAIDRTHDLFSNIRVPQRSGRGPGEDGPTRHNDRWTAWIMDRRYERQTDLARDVETDLRACVAWRPDAAYVSEVRREFEAPFAHMNPIDPPVRMVGSIKTLDAIHSLCGLEQFCYLLADEPALAWLEARTQAAVAHVHAIAPLGLSPLAQHAEDIAYKGRTMYSSTMLRRYLFPGPKHIVSAWHEYGVRVMFHSDGYLMDVLDDLLDCGFDGLHPNEVAAGMDLAEVRRKVGRRMFLAGGIDVSRLLPFGSVIEVRAACDRAVAVASPGYFIGSTTEMQWPVPLRNVRAVYATPRRLAARSPAPAARAGRRPRAIRA